MILLPTHDCTPGPDPAVAYGDLDAANVATCAARIRWERGERMPGCGARLAVCHGCGLRTRVMRPGESEAAPCGACGGTRRPDAVATPHETPKIQAIVDQTRSIVQQPAPSDAGRPQEKPARRAPARRVKKGTADQGDGPLFK